MILSSWDSLSSAHLCAKSRISSCKIENGNTFDHIIKYLHNIHVMCVYEQNKIMLRHYAGNPNSYFKIKYK